MGAVGGSCPPQFQWHIYVLIGYAFDKFLLIELQLLPTQRLIDLVCTSVMTVVEFYSEIGEKVHLLVKLNECFQMKDMAIQSCH